MIVSPDGAGRLWYASGWHFMLRPDTGPIITGGPHATEEEARAAYAEATRIHHPDLPGFPSVQLPRR